MQAHNTAQALGMKDSSLFREKAYIDGLWVSSDSGETDDVLNPANGEVLGTVPRCGASETRRAIDQCIPQEVFLLKSEPVIIVIIFDRRTTV